jgi:hypothetical protein
MPTKASQSSPRSSKEEHLSRARAFKASRTALNFSEQAYDFQKMLNRQSAKLCLFQSPPPCGEVEKAKLFRVGEW